MVLWIAAWMRWQSVVTESGEAVVFDEPLAGKTAELLDGADSDEARVAALLTLSAVFPRALAADPRFVAAVTGAYLSLSAHGAVEAARRVTE
jgi:fructuronate reductase